MVASPSSQPKISITYRDRTGQYYLEDLGSDIGDHIGLEMVLIPPGKFLMGSPNDELKNQNDETPRHEVTIGYPFFAGKYLVTQAQWKAVAGLKQVNRELKLDPSHFKGGNRPVESVSWYDAVEFCDRLAEHTGRPYRLPSEAEWEYACRAGTETPFHFGETITTDLANYRGTDWKIDDETTYSGAYGDGPHGKYREETTDVGNFDVANAFGLYDMHGNVWEWCLDHYLDSYEATPLDGSPLLTKNEDARRVLRGGSWFFNPELCRSALRGNNRPADHSDLIGFRVVCGSARASNSAG